MAGIEIKRKKDYIAFIAVSLFVLLVIFELLLVTALPTFIYSNRAWDRDAALQELIAEQDLLRAQIKSAKAKSDSAKGERKLLGDNMDNITRYLRRNQDKMTLDQINDLRGDISAFRDIYEKWKSQEQFVKIEKIETDSYTKFLAEEKCNIECKPEEKPATEQEK